MKKPISLITAIIILFVAALGIGLLVRNAKTAPDSPNGGDIAGGDVACTMEALICPDGSGVGRSGPECKFLACPNQENFRGKLVQIEGKFFLEMNAPEPIEGAQKYNLPLNIRVSNALKDFVNQEVVVYGTFSEGNTLDVETLDYSKNVPLTQVTVGVGETKTLGGISITLNSVPEDYRCPIDAICQEQGAIVANVTFKAGAETKTFNMPSDEVPQTFAGKKISITQVQPSLLSAEPTQKGAYRVTFKVE